MAFSASLFLTVCIAACQVRDRLLFSKIWFAFMQRAMEFRMRAASALLLTLEYYKNIAKYWSKTQLHVWVGLPKKKWQRRLWQSEESVCKPTVHNSSLDKKRAWDHPQVLQTVASRAEIASSKLGMFTALRDEGNHVWKLFSFYSARWVSFKP